MKLITITTLLTFFLFQFAKAQEYNPTYFQKAELLEDLSFVQEKVENMHPLFLDEVFAEKWRVKYDLLDKQLLDSLSINQFYVQLSTLVGELEDTHTGVSFPYSERKKYMIGGGGVSMPFSITIKGHKLYVNEYFGEDRTLAIAGKQVLAINGISSEQIIVDIRSIAGVRERECSDQSVEKLFAMCFWALYGEVQNYQLQVSDVDSLVKIAAVNNATYFELKKKYASSQKPEYYQLNFSDDNKLAKLKIASFYGGEKYNAFLKEAFEEIKVKGFRQLIIDVRNNPGGRSRGVDSLLNYLTDKSYSQYKSIGVKVSEELKANYKQKRPESYALIANLPNDTLVYLNSETFIHEPRVKESAFTGDVFVVINERSNSAAATFAGIVKENQLGSIVGNKATGEHIRYYGDFLSYELPNTKLMIYVSPKEFIQFGGSNLDKGVEPDVLLKDFEFRGIL